MENNFCGNCLYFSRYYTSAGYKFKATVFGRCLCDNYSRQRRVCIDEQNSLSLIPKNPEPCKYFELADKVNGLQIKEQIKNHLSNISDNLSYVSFLLENSNQKD